VRVTGRFHTPGQRAKIIDPFGGPPFVESFASGAFRRSIAHDRAGLRVLSNHGLSRAGLLPIGTLRSIVPSGEFEFDLLDVGYAQELLPALRAGQLGMSFRFNPLATRVNLAPTRATDNPEGIPEVTILEAGLVEISVVTFPAYAAGQSAALADVA